MSHQDVLVERLTEVFKSLADPHRVKIVVMLSTNGEMNVSAISDELDHSQPAVSHHLTMLRNAGLIDFRREGKFNYYFLNRDVMADLIGVVFPSPRTVKYAVPGFEIAVKRK